MKFLLAILIAVGVTAASAASAAAPTFHVGSKRFTESYILGEIVARTARAAGEAQVTFKPGLGNTAVVFAALKSGAIDVYAEYSGTLAFELLGSKSALGLEDSRAAFHRYRAIREGERHYVDWPDPIHSAGSMDAGRRGDPPVASAALNERRSSLPSTQHGV